MQIGTQATAITDTTPSVRIDSLLDLGAASRTLLTEVDVANPGVVLMPGMYAQVRMQFPTAPASLMIPAAALVIRAARGRHAGDPDAALSLANQRKPR